VIYNFHQKILSEPYCDHKELGDRILSALKTGGIQALGQMLNHPFSTFAIAEEGRLAKK
jgi:hypothetical protein